MPYHVYFQLADDTISHLNSFIPSVSNPLIVSKYIGFVSVSAVTVYELAIKAILISFSHTKHEILGNFAQSYFERINGRIKIKIIKEDYLKRFGEGYVNIFEETIQNEENLILQDSRKSIISSYSNIIEWRNSFAHEGIIPSTVTYREIVDSYEMGKKIIDCLARTMTS
ncbi:MAG: HEPN domain-containing protein [Ignavibacteriaceae bacterium]